MMKLRQFLVEIRMKERQIPKSIADLSSVIDEFKKIDFKKFATDVTEEIINIISDTHSGIRLPAQAEEEIIETIRNEKERHEYSRIK